MNSIFNWLKTNRVEVLFFLLIVSSAVFLRFYRLSEYMTFLGDEGRDAIIIKDILVTGHIPLLGPPTSVGNIYLGPLYYYMMAIPMKIFYLDPISAAGMVASIGVATVVLMYFLARAWFGTLAAILASFLYSISPVNIIYSRSSWNPNPAPFFSLLAIGSFYLARKSGNYLWLIVTGASVSATVQMHYLALILIPVFLVLWIVEIIERQKLENKQKYFALGTIGAVASFLLVMSPLFIFDLRHNFLNYNAITNLLFGQANNVDLGIFNNFTNILPIFKDKLIGRYIAGQNDIAAYFLVLLITVPLLVSGKRMFEKRKIDWPHFSLGVWLLVGLWGLSFYKSSIHDHYLGFLNPAPYLAIGAAGKFILKKFRVVFVVTLSFILGYLNLVHNPLLYPPNNQLGRTKAIAKHVITMSGNKPFNFALISKNNYDAAYIYYLDINGHKPKQVPFDITDQLLVVCEDPVCQPVYSPKYEIAGFGWTRIESEEEAFGTKIYKLVHNPH